MAEQMYVKLGDICLLCDPPEQGGDGSFCKRLTYCIKEQNACSIICGMEMVDGTLEYARTSVAEGCDCLLLSLGHNLQPSSR